MKAEIVQMLRQGGGTIVNTASIAGLVGGFGGAYSAAKHAMVDLTMSINRVTPALRNTHSRRVM